MKIALDAMGGDLAPKAIVEGAVLAARDFGIAIALIGDREMIAKELGEHRTQGLELTIEHAGEAVGMDESPLESLLNKPDSSIHVGLEMLKQGRADGFVSAGNSGAVMAAAMVILGTLPGVDRPAIASLVPTSAGFALLIDAGANTEVKPINLVQFGVMGSVYWKHVHQAEHPRVAILSNGEEESKGTELTRSAAAMLAAMTPEINYIGYVEGRDINRAHADVVVTDGFTGNVALKTMEGFAAFMLGNLRELFSSGLMRRIGYLLVRKRLSALRARLDPAEYGGAPLMGVGGVTIIAHGSSNARAIRNAVRAAANEALVNQVNVEIVAILAQAPEASSAEKPAGKGIRGLFGRMRERLHRHRETGERRPDRADRGEGGRKTGSLAAPEHSEHQNGVEVVLHPEAVLDPQVYGVNHRLEGSPNGVVKAAAGESHEGSALAG
ncbi:MAG TPA: phosphate acyltransferase PlsX, partial [Candidatus Binataceae bacterium]|nr:phosphate acyltransferase PlsX [Candidatus Binataceae bacterium]